MEDFGDDIVSGSAGSSKTEPRQCSSLRKNGFVCIKDKPCKIVEMTTSKTGKHGSAKVHLTGIDIFTNKKYEDICPSTSTMEVPIVSRREYSLTAINNGFLELLCDDGTIKDDVKLEDNDLGKEILQKYEQADSDDIVVTVTSALGIEQPSSVKIVSAKKAG